LVFSQIINIYLKFILVSPIQQFFLEMFSQYGVLNYSTLKTLLDRKIKSGEYTMLADYPDKQFNEELAKIADSYKSAFYLRDQPDETLNKVSVFFC
jgi:hypothetical protein